MYNKTELNQIDNANDLIDTTLTWINKIKVASHERNDYLFSKMNELKNELINKDLNMHQKIESIYFQLRQINTKVENNKVERLVKSGYDYNEALFNLEESAEYILNELKNSS